MGELGGLISPFKPRGKKAYCHLSIMSIWQGGIMSEAEKKEGEAEKKKRYYYYQQKEKKAKEVKKKK